MAIPLLLYPLAVGGATLYATIGDHGVGENVREFFGLGDTAKKASAGGGAMTDLPDEVKDEIADATANPHGANKVFYVDNRSSILPGIPKLGTIGKITLGVIAAIAVWGYAKK